MTTIAAEGLLAPNKSSYSAANYDLFHDAPEALLRMGDLALGQSGLRQGESLTAISSQVTAALPPTDAAQVENLPARQLLRQSLGEGLEVRTLPHWALLQAAAQLGDLYIDIAHPKNLQSTKTVAGLWLTVHFSPLAIADLVQGNSGPLWQKRRYVGQKIASDPRTEPTRTAIKASLLDLDKEALSRRHEAPISHRQLAFLSEFYGDDVHPQLWGLTKHEARCITQCLASRFVALLLPENQPNQKEAEYAGRVLALLNGEAQSKITGQEAVSSATVLKNRRDMILKLRAATPPEYFLAVLQAKGQAELLPAPESLPPVLGAGARIQPKPAHPKKTVRQPSEKPRSQKAVPPAPPRRSLPVIKAKDEERIPIEKWPKLLAESDDDEVDWQERALCAQTDPEAFFPEKGESTREAKKICAGCEVRSECLDYALAHGERFGIWGGMTERERRRLRRRAV